MSIKEKFEKYNGRLAALVCDNVAYNISSVMLDKEEVRCYDVVSEDEGTHFYTFTFAELEKANDVKIFIFEEI